MRFRTHLLASALVGAVLYPRRPLSAAALTLAGTLIDLDHLLLYGVRTGDWSVSGALRYDRYRNGRIYPGDNRPRYGPLRSPLHQPLLALPPLWAAARVWPALRPLAVGLTLHLLLDHWDWPARRLAQLRADGKCDACGRRAKRLRVWRAGKLGAYSYRALCRSCHDAALRAGPVPRLVLADSV